MEKKDLQPKVVFDCFAEVNRIPRPSKHEDLMMEFLVKFAQDLGLEYKTDETGNVVIKKPATKGYEGRPTIVLQSHMDMVGEKNADVEFDFKKDPIQTYIDGEWLKAKGTTLGADDGIGVAMEMAVLKSNDIEHGPIECVFTRDEETGLGGAIGMKSDFMNGDYLINLDSEDEGEIFVSCAGGANTVAEFPFDVTPIPAGYYTCKVMVKGLMGGHSGDDINKNRANANKQLVRFLCQELKKTDLRLVDIQTGGLHNAIPREGYAIVAVPNDFKDEMRADLNIFGEALKEEFSETEKNIQVLLETEENAKEAQEPAQAQRQLSTFLSVFNGVFAMSQTIPGFVETSSNLASIHRVGNKVDVVTSQRSSIMSNRKHVSAVVRAAFELGGATKIVTGDGYPGWNTDPNSPLVQKAVETYKQLFKKEPIVRGIHAGLECGLFSEKYPHMDMVSVGPTMRGVHSPDERLLIPTVQMVWDHLLALLKAI